MIDAVSCSDFLLKVQLTPQLAEEIYHKILFADCSYFLISFLIFISATLFTWFGLKRNAKGEIANITEMQIAAGIMIFFCLLSMISMYFFISDIFFDNVAIINHFR